MKKATLFIIIILCIVGITFGIYKIKPNLLEPKNSTSTLQLEKIDYEEIIKNILSKNIKDIDEDFLKWIKNRYGNDTILKINDYLKENEYDRSIWHKYTRNSYYVLKDLYNDSYSKMDNVKIIEEPTTETTLSFVGDVSLADNWDIMPKYDSRNKKVEGILSKDVLNIMRSSNVMVANNEFTISSRGTPLNGKQYTFRADPKRLTIYNEMGVDLVTLANNHIYDFGSIAFNDAIDSLNKYKIPFIGAGKNKKEAQKTYYFIVNGYKIAFLNATRAEKNIMTPEATDKSGGVFRCYNPKEFKEAIKKAKKNSDYVIALVHWGTEDTHVLENVQKETGREYIDSGADVVIGAHAHTLQGMEIYKDKLIAYNLGDFIFNNKKEETAILSMIISNDGDITYKFIPCLQKDVFTDTLKGQEKNKLIKKVNGWSKNATINEDGLIKKG